MVEVTTRPTHTVEHPPGYVQGRLFSDPDNPIVLRTDFDVEAHQSDARGYLDIDELDGESAHLDEAVGRDLAFVWRLESAALAETRAMLSSWTANEARVTAFIATWAFERYWMARASRDLLEQAGMPTAARRRPTFTSRAHDAYVERVLPLVSPVLGGAVKEPITAGHMARMAFQESAFDACQRALLNRLTGKAYAVLETVIERRGSILDFFRAEATARISRSRREQLSAAVHIGPGWAPLRAVGVSDPDEETALTSIFGSTESWFRLVESDQVVGSLLPGSPQPGVTQVRRAFRQRHQRRRGNDIDDGNVRDDLNERTGTDEHGV